MRHLSKSDFNEPRQYGNKPWRTVAYPAPRVRVTIQHDDNPMDPFKMADGHWPMLVRGCHYSNLVDEKVALGKEVKQSFNRSMQQWFTLEGLIHNQHHIYKILEGAAEYQQQIHGCKHTTDPDIVDAVMDEYAPDETDFEKRAKLYELAGVICEVVQVSGHSQGDWAELLMIAPRETIKLLRGGGVDEATVRKDMQAQAQLYKGWAYGNCYGYRVEILPEAVGDPEDAIEDDWCDPADEPEWSCSGHTGDWETSGLLDQVNEVLGYAPVRQMIEAYERCEAGMHSWVDDPTITDPDYRCKHCGEPYGDPEGVSDNLTGAVA